MTITEAKQKLIDIASAEVGYHEGSNNYTKYAADPNITKLYGWTPQNQPWCCTFVNWVFLKAFGYDIGSQLTYGGTAACANSAQLFKNAGAYVYFPQIGDQAFYYSGGGINHTGIVVKVEGSEFTAIEGNYSDKVSLVKHNVGHTDVAGFGRPKWVVATGSVLEHVDSGNTASASEPVKESHSLKLNLVQMNNKYSDDVVLLQALLNKWKFPCGSCDGFFGVKTQSAVNKAQAYFGLTVDGIVGKDTWSKLMEYQK